MPAGKRAGGRGRYEGQAQVQAWDASRVILFYTFPLGKSLESRVTGHVQLQIPAQKR